MLVRSGPLSAISHQCWVWQHIAGQQHRDGIWQRRNRRPLDVCNTPAPAPPVAQVTGDVDPVPGRHNKPFPTCDRCRIHDLLPSGPLPETKMNGAMTSTTQGWIAGHVVIIFSVLRYWSGAGADVTRRRQRQATRCNKPMPKLPGPPALCAREALIVLQERVVPYLITCRRIGPGCRKNAPGKCANIGVDVERCGAISHDGRNNQRGWADPPALVSLSAVEARSGRFRRMGGVGKPDRATAALPNRRASHDAPAIAATFQGHGNGRARQHGRPCTRGG